MFHWKRDQRVFVEDSFLTGKNTVSLILIILIENTYHYGLCFVSFKDSEIWNDQAQDILKKAINRAENINKNVAQNIIMFLGDGMGPSTVTAARILKGQLAGFDGEVTVLAWESFSSFGLSKVNFDLNILFMWSHASP